MQEVLVDVREHAGGSLEGVVRGLEPDILVSVLIRSMTRQDCGYVEDDRTLLIRQRVLRCRFVGKGIEPCAVSAASRYMAPSAGLPCEGDLDVVLVHGKAQVQ